mgnify:CR=1 FL=1
MARDDIADFGTYLAEERHASQNTICSYLRDVTQFSAYLREHQSCTLRQAGGEMIQDYMSWMRGRGKSAASVTRFLASVKSFYNFLLSAGAVKANPAKSISADRAERKYPEILTSKEVELFLEQPRCVDAKGYRDHAMLELLYATGIRVSEVRYITVEAVRQGKAEVSLKGKIRVILLPGKLCRKLLKYAQKQKTASGAIFRTKSGKELGRRQIWAEMKSLCKYAGVMPGKVFPHNLRHMFATVFYRACRDIVKLSDLLGHSSIETTRIYLLTSGAEHQRTLDRLGLIS